VAGTNQDAGRGYLLDNSQEEAGQRLAALSTLFDPWTFLHLETLGIGPGWRCWEVGAGGPGVAAWMAGAVGEAGTVLATDIDVSWMPDGATGFEVRRHDVGVDAPPPGPFDLVHARLVLVHVPRRDEALAAMVGALRPGGWLLVEDADPALQPLTCIDEWGPDQVLANKLRRDFRTLLTGRGADVAYGRTLPRALRKSGLVDVAADAFFPVAGPACTLLERATVEQMRHRLLASGLATAREIDGHLANVVAGRLDLATSPMISAWGRKPAGA
jgi:SAM-dependent methyltransferase